MKLASSSVVCTSLIFVVTLVSLVWADDLKVDSAAVTGKAHCRLYESFPEGELGNIIKLGQALIEEHIDTPSDEGLRGQRTQLHVVSSSEWTRSESGLVHWCCLGVSCLVAA